jgi:hypothetical protein
VSLRISDDKTESAITSVLGVSFISLLKPTDQRLTGSGQQLF